MENSGGVKTVLYLITLFISNTIVRVRLILLVQLYKYFVSDILLLILGGILINNKEVMLFMVSNNNQQKCLYYIYCIIILIFL